MTHTTGSKSSRLSRSSSDRIRSLSETLALLILGIAIIAAIVVSPAGGSMDKTTVYRVNSGDSLWLIAAEHRPQGMSTAQAVEAITQINGLTDSSLQKGVSLRIPVEDDGLATAQAMR